MKKKSIKINIKTNITSKQDIRLTDFYYKKFNLGHPPPVIIGDTNIFNLNLFTYSENELKALELSVECIKDLNKKNATMEINDFNHLLKIIDLVKELDKQLILWKLAGRA